MKEGHMHKLLKQKGKMILNKMGFSDNEIFFEKRINLEKIEKGWEYLRPDIMGIKNGRKVVVECGRFESSYKVVVECGRFESSYHPNKIEILTNLGFEIIHLPY